MGEIDQPLQIDYIGLSISHVDNLTKIYKSLTDKMSAIGIVKEESISDDDNEEFLLLQALKKNILDVTNSIVESLLEESQEDGYINQLTVEDIINALSINPNYKLSNEDSSIILTYEDGEFYDQNNNLFDLNDLKNTRWKIQNK